MPPEPFSARPCRAQSNPHPHPEVRGRELVERPSLEGRSDVGVPSRAQGILCPSSRPETSPPSTATSRRSSASACRVEPGETVAIIGANGAGKSTFLKTIAGLLPSPPGAVRFDGGDIGGARAFENVRRGIVLVPEGRRLFPSLSVEENLLIGGYRPARTLDARARLRALSRSSPSGGGCRRRRFPAGSSRCAPSAAR